MVPHSTLVLVLPRPKENISHEESRFHHLPSPRIMLSIRIP